MEIILLALMDFVNRFLDLAGSNPFVAMWYFFIYGGWLVFLWILLWIGRSLYLGHIQTKTVVAKEWSLLRIAVPKNTEQTCRAVENLFIHLAGTHSPYSWTETWVQGLVQSPLAVEIVSTEGHVGFYIYCERKYRNLVEAAIYAQYPDADIDQVEDYTNLVPANYPDEEYDLYGTELQTVKPDPFPIRTYFEFEDKISGEFKDPLSALLENFARLGPGEHVWYQIVMTPAFQDDFRKRSEIEINKIKGVEMPKPKKTVLDEVLDIPYRAAGDMLGILTGSPAAEHKKEDKKNDFPKLFALSPGERYVLEALERKAAKVGFYVKIRFVYAAKKTVMKKPRALHPFLGAIKQVNTFDMQALRPDSKLVGMNSNFWWFKNMRNNFRKNKLYAAYRHRSNWAGLPSFFLSVEELATLWHFPIFMQVKAPSLLRTTAKKSEAPPNIPFGD